MEDNAIHFTTSPLNAYVPIVGGIVLLTVGLLGYIFMPHATSTIIACAMFGMMTIAVGVSQFSKLDTPLVSIYPDHLINKGTRIDFEHIASFDRQGKIVLGETTHQLPLLLLRSIDRFKILKLLEDRLNVEA
jgi:hypothetical protein